MKNTVKKSLLCLSIVSTLGAVASTEAMAQDAGFFVSGQAGQSRFDIGGGFGKKNATAAGIGVGYNFNPIVALELGYNDYGKVNFSGVDGTAKSTQLSVLLTAPIANEFSVYGRLGAASTERKISGFGFSDSERKSEAVYGVGLAYNFAKNIKGTVEYQKLNDTKVDAITAGVKFNF